MIKNTTVFFKCFTINYLKLNFIFLNRYLFVCNIYCYMSGISHYLYGGYCSGCRDCKYFAGGHLGHGLTKQLGSC